MALHHTKLKKAVKDYSPLVEAGKTREELFEALAADEANYSADEMNEIADKLFESSQQQPSKGETKVNKPTKQTPKEEVTGLHKLYKEAKGEFENGEFIQTRVLRENVKLHPETVEVLNNDCSPSNPIQYIEQ